MSSIPNSRCAGLRPFRRRLWLRRVVRDGGLHRRLWPSG